MTIRYLRAPPPGHILLYTFCFQNYSEVKHVMLIESDEWEANYLLDYLDEEADYTMDRDPKVAGLRDKVQTAFDRSGFKRIDLIGN